MIDQLQLAIDDGAVIRRNGGKHGSEFARRRIGPG